MKRAVDVVGAAVALLILAVPMLVIACVVQIRLGSPVLFTQVRPGRDGVPFRMIKFRTMREATDAAGRTLPDEQRLTRLGQALRATSLDELPELWNVLRGDMSLVGPRPLLMAYLPLYTPVQARRHEVRPGITGWAQVNGRNALSWEEKFALDVWYVDHASCRVDLKIVVLTIWKTLSRDGITQQGHATMPDFTGSEPRQNVTRKVTGRQT
ncbi:sugar transferase [Mycolicibacterium hippocampi]|uniref:Lipid carrier: UDP-N-acetylgalactosaminyltransferase n=1 Tax=Mycolicibacterium hippocampi TaxID=659824 RepID=A0A850PS97_9MYCO|nr:sugar transferase [Mycolicibacterium hippocampi]NVN53452.1 Lipid carrier : UDP-N-acetylgalactosaminyltransferase [Mycolicibacterium hippocampi]